MDLDTVTQNQIIEVKKAAGLIERSQIDRLIDIDNAIF